MRHSKPNGNEARVCLPPAGAPQGGHYCSRAVRLSWSEMYKAAWRIRRPFINRGLLFWFLINSLIISHMYTMFHDPIYSFPSSLDPHYFPPQPSCLCRSHYCLCAHACEAIHGTWITYQRSWAPQRKMTPLLLAAISGQEFLSEGWSLMRPCVSVKLKC